MRDTNTKDLEEELIHELNWRYATKKFDTDRALSESTLQTLLEALRLSPSSMGLQPYKFLRISNAALRSELRTVSSNQPQITDAAELIVFAASTMISETEVERFVRMGGELRDYTEEAIQKRIASLNKFISGKKDDELFEWSARQAYIAIGQLLTSAASLGVDACPMEGINKGEYNRILELEKLHLKSLAVVTLGYRSEYDQTATLPKIRKPFDELFITKN